MGLVFLSQPDRGTVIALERESGGRLEPFCHRADTRRKFGMLEKERNERQPQACFFAFSQGRDQTRRLFMQGCLVPFATQDKADLQRTQGICELIASDGRSRKASG